MLLLAAGLPFADVIGVEYSPELHESALANLAVASVGRQGAQAPARSGRPRPTSLLEDAREFSFPPTPLVVYLNNPFPETLMREVLASLSDAYERSPRPVTLVYQQLEHGDAEHRTRNRDLLGELPFLAPLPLKVRGLANRLLLAPYALAGYASPEARGI